MSTQYSTGEDYVQYQAQVKNDVSAVLGHTAAITAYQNRFTALTKALTSPVAQNGGVGLTLPSIAINAANNSVPIIDVNGNPQRYTY
jgi:hypothetical protein